MNPEILMSLYPNPVEDELNFVFTKKSLEAFNQSRSNQSSNIEIKKTQQIAGFFLFISIFEDWLLLNWLGVSIDLLVSFSW